MDELFKDKHDNDGDADLDLGAILGQTVAGEWQEVEEQGTSQSEKPGPEEEEDKEEVWTGCVRP